MSVLICLGALIFLMYVAYRGYSVIIFAPIAALLAVLLTDPQAIPAAYTGLFMDKLAGFVKNYFPVFLLGALFGKLIEVSGFSKSIVKAVTSVIGREAAMLAVVLVCGILTYGGVSLFVAVFAVYPFAVELFRAANIPKRLMPATIALGAFTFTMDALPLTPQIQNIIPTTYFKTTAGAAPVLGTIGAVFVFVLGMIYLESRRRQAARAGEGYGESQQNEPSEFDFAHLPPAFIAFLPLVVVFGVNLLLGGFPKLSEGLISSLYGTDYILPLNTSPPDLKTQISSIQALWAVEGALIAGILAVVVSAFPAIKKHFNEASVPAVGGALLASANTATEYGFGAVIASLPGFIVLKDALKAIPNPLVNEALTVTSLAGITGSASGGMSIALAAMSKDFIAAADRAGIPLEVFHRVASMASGGMDTLPHNGAVITLLAVTGLTHAQSYKDIFVITCLKTLAVFFIIGVYYATGLV